MASSKLQKQRRQHLEPGCRFTRLVLGDEPERSPDGVFRSPRAFDRSEIHLEVYNPIDPCVQDTDPLIRVPNLLLVDLVKLQVDLEDAVRINLCPSDD